MSSSLCVAFCPGCILRAWSRTAITAFSAVCQSPTETLNTEGRSAVKRWSGRTRSMYSNGRLPRASSYARTYEMDNMRVEKQKQIRLLGGRIKPLTCLFVSCKLMAPRVLNLHSYTLRGVTKAPKTSYAHGARMTRSRFRPFRQRCLRTIE
eukprot:1546176-Pleurochrysis_carterae.AAC.2